MTALDQQYGTVLSLVRKSFVDVRRKETLDTRRRNVLPARVQRGKHVDAATLRRALEHSTKEVLGPVFSSLRRGQPRAATFATLPGVPEDEDGDTPVETPRARWMRMLGTLIVAFYCHHPNRPQAILQVTLGQVRVTCVARGDCNCGNCGDCICLKCVTCI
jgi:hypothetical protein